MPLSRLSGRGMLMTGILLLALVWIIVNTSLAAAVAGPVAMITANVRLVVGLTILGLLAYWALVEAEGDDDVEDAIEKTSDRAAAASGGFINVTRVFLGGLAAVIVTSGDAMVDLLGQAPMIVGQLGIGLLGIGAGMGTISVRMLALLALVIIIVSAVTSERTS